MPRGSSKKTRSKQRSSHENIAKQRHFLSSSKLFLASANHSCHIVHQLLPAYQSNVWDRELHNLKPKTAWDKSLSWLEPGNQETFRILMSMDKSVRGGYSACPQLKHQPKSWPDKGFWTVGQWQKHSIQFKECSRPRMPSKAGLEVWAAAAYTPKLCQNHPRNCWLLTDNVPTCYMHLSPAMLRLNILQQFFASAALLQHLLAK